jgi:hypothetical protein
MPGALGLVPPAWMLELAAQIRMIEPGALLPTGVIVGSAIIERVSRVDDADGDAELFRWHLADVRRIDRTLKPTGHPQPAWFTPF